MIEDKVAAPSHQNRLNILIVTPRFLPEVGGIETHVAEVTKFLAAAGHSVTILTTDRSGSLPREQDVNGVKIIRRSAWPRNSDYYFAPELCAEIFRRKCDIVHIQGCHTLVAPMAMIASLVKRAPFVVSFHSGGHSSRIRNALRAIQWKVLSPLVGRAVKWIAVSDFEAQLFSEKMGVPREAFDVIPNGASMPRRASQSPLQEGLIVSIGRLERYKGHHRAIEALPFILQRMPNARLRIIGEGPYEDALRELVDDLNLSSKVEIGGVPSSDRLRLANILSSASLVVLLSDYEANPVAVMEALSLGRPVLATNCSGFKELAENGLIDVVDNNASPLGIADAVFRAVKNLRSPSNLQLPDWNACAARIESSLADAVNTGVASRIPLPGTNSAIAS
jgi:glycosyltransferase involved in cell wall biosynthesis